MKVSIFGTGYVGLVTGACLAITGIEVSCFDIDKKRVLDLKNGIIPIYEPGLEELIHKCMKINKIKFTSSLNESVNQADIAIICVGTPGKEMGETCLESVMNAAKIIAENAENSFPVLIKSTVPVGTAKKVEDRIQTILNSRSVQFEMPVASNPEFLHEGVAISDFNSPDRIVLGTNNVAVIQLVRKLYSDFLDKEERLIVMSRESSELTKYAANSFLATKISFMNELSKLCHKMGANIDEVRQGIGTDPAIAERYLFAGCGFGGSCLPKDIDSLIYQAEDHGNQLQLLSAVRDVNELQKEYLFSMAYNNFSGDVKGKIFTVWGLSFKPNTDDIRSAPSIAVINRLLEKGALIKAHDPIISKEPEKFCIQHDNLMISTSAIDAAKGADCLIICTEWQEYKNLDYNLLAKSMNNKLIIDGRNSLNIDTVKSKEFVYFDMGRSIH